MGEQSVVVLFTSKFLCSKCKKATCLSSLLKLSSTIQIYQQQSYESNKIEQKKAINKIKLQYVSNTY